MKPRISKRDGCWRVERPGYGFTADSVDEYRSWREAVGSLCSAPATAQAAVTFGSYTLGSYTRGWPVRGTIRMEDT